MKRIVIKIGGAILEKPLDALFEAIARLQQTADVVLVHGGGPQVTEMSARLGEASKVVEGRRITSDLDLNILKWVIRGQLNVDLVAQAMRSGIRSVGLSGADGGTIQVTKRPIWNVSGQSVDFGHVGDFRTADTVLLTLLLQSGILPILCPPGVDRNGNLYNINADTVALEIAKAMQAEELLLVTETGAILDSNKQAIRRMTATRAAEGVAQGWIEGGMKVKTEVGFEAMTRGIPSVWIVGPESVDSKKFGTQLVRDINV